MCVCIYIYIYIMAQCDSARFQNLLFILSLGSYNCQIGKVVHLKLKWTF